MEIFEILKKINLTGYAREQEREREREREREV